MKRFNDFYTAYNFLEKHKMVHPSYPNYPDLTYSKGFADSLYVAVVKVNPVNDTVEDDRKLNTKTQVWLEFGPVVEADEDLGLNQLFTTVHDTRLDCGADTFEEAIIELANLVDKYYRDNGTER